MAADIAKTSSANISTDNGTTATTTSIEQCYLGVKAMFTLD